ncbi:hypothetical protein F2Q69_00043614 [Brassica cretica]|uniref:Uncharacterized protein n=1 Tax=Brassica cretica TaxID=69181 RepID=A0A8S9NJ04_BRACR|nr:hypothetical protein F2Q69_00043614 [Brassica cretica]
MEVVSSHLELYWRSCDRFTRGISTLTRVDGRRLAYPGGLPEAGRGADAGWPTLVVTMASTRVGRNPRRVFTFAENQHFQMAF